MNTFHIYSDDPLAAQAAPEVREIATRNPDLWIAIRGEYFDEGDGTFSEHLYTVSACPDQEDQSRYCWEYVQAGGWLADFDGRIEEEAAE